MKNAYFNKIIDVGPLYLRYVFLEFEGEPILFLCSDENSNLYLCLCSEMRYEQRWLISKSNVMLLKKMISGETDIRTAFEQPSNLIVNVCSADGNEDSKVISTTDVDELDFPEPNAFFDGDQQAAYDFLRQLSEESLIGWNKTSFSLEYQNKKAKAQKHKVGDKKSQKRYIIDSMFCPVFINDDFTSCKNPEEQRLNQYKDKKDLLVAV